MSKARARKIKLILFDVDGVLTDGTIFLFPAPGGATAGAGAGTTQAAREAAQHHAGFAIQSHTTIEAKGFNAHDGTGFSLAHLGGLETGFITKRISETVALRARDLKVTHVYQGQADKAAAFREILANTGLKANEVAFVGDDVIDLPVMRQCGLAIAVANARPEVRAMAHWITKCDGGRGAARDAVEYILKAQGKLKKVVDAYIANRPLVQAAVKAKS